MVYYTLQKQETQPAGHVHQFSASDLFRIFGCSSSGYYSWKKRFENPVETKTQKEDREIKEKMISIIHKHCGIPGARTFRTYLWRDYDLRVSRKRITRLMKEMRITAYVPHKDAYKGQATHFHPCDAKQNYVDRDFGDSPRKVILTDITYLYYGSNRELCYLCAFKDGFTREILGSAVSRHMDVSLVTEAYHRMMDQHRSELNHPDVLVHSDQGSQYLSTTFQTLLEDDGFVQSMSRRGNSQDNAPMESFFGRMKCQLLKLIEMCPDYQTVRDLIAGYMHHYNEKAYQYDLAGLTPAEFYQYKTTGVYPLDNYYGISGDRMRPVESLVEDHLNYLKKKREENVQKKKEAEKKLLPMHIIAADQKKLKKEIQKLNTLIEDSNEEIRELEALLERVRAAGKAYETADEELKKKLENPQEWKNTPPFDYVTEMDALY